MQKSVNDSPKKDILSPISISAIFLISFLCLFSFLNLKPPQHDEGVNGWIIAHLANTGFYAYDPSGYHGPLHYYLLFFFKILLGRNLYALRFSAVLFGWASIFLLTQFRKYIGKPAACMAALMACISPGTIFYSRYAIHESGLLFFSILTFYGFLRKIYRNDAKSLWEIAAGVTGMLIMKETFILMIISLTFAAGCEKIHHQWDPSHQGWPCPERTWNPTDLRKIFLVCGITCTALYTGFFMHWDGILQIPRSFWEWAVHGVSHKHGQTGFFRPPLYWVHLFIQYEWPAVLGIMVAFPLLAPASRTRRLLVYFAFFNFVIYSMIPYKTPWCILQLIWPFLVIAGMALQEITNHPQKNIRRATAVLAAGLIFLSAQKTISLNFFHFDDEKEVYVDVQTYRSVMEMIHRLETLADREPSLKHMPIHIVMKAYWPLSWLLGDFTGDEYFTDSLPVHGDAALILCDKDRARALELKLQNRYFLQSLKFNPAQDEINAYFDVKIFKDFFPGSTPIFEPTIIPAAKPGEGLRAAVFSGSNAEGSAVKEEIVPTINFSWENDAEKPLPAPISIIFHGKLHIPEKGVWGFYLSSDDGSQFFIKNELIVDNSGNHPEKTVKNQKLMFPGWYPITIRYNDSGGAAAIRFWWETPSGRQENISPAYWKPE